MPLDDALRAHTGDDAFDDGSAMLERSGARRVPRVGGRVRPALAADLLRPARAVLVRAARRPPRRAARATTTTDYDEFGVGDRLGSPGLDGPRSSTQLAIWLAVAGAGLVLASVAPRLRGRAVVVARGRRRRPARRLRVLRRRLRGGAAPPRRPRSPACRSPSSWPSGSGSRRVADARRGGRRRREADDDGVAAAAAAPPPADGRRHDRRRSPRPRSPRRSSLAAFFGNELRAPGLRPAVHEGADRPRRRARRHVLRGRAAQQGPVRAVRVPGRRVPHVRRRLLVRRSRRSCSSPPLLCAVRGASTAPRRRHVAARRRGGRRRRCSSTSRSPGRLLGRALQPQHHDRRPRDRWTLALRVVAVDGDPPGADSSRRRRRRAARACACRRSSRRCSRRRSSRPSRCSASAASTGPSGGGRSSCWSVRRGDRARAARLVRLRGKFAEFWGGWWIYGRLPELAASGAACSASSGWRGTRPTRTTGRGRCRPLALVRRPSSPSSAGRSCAGPTGAAARRRSLDRRRLDRAGPRPALLVALLLDPRPADVAGRGHGGRRPRSRSPRRAASGPPLRAALPALVVLAVMFTGTEAELRDGVAAASNFTGVDDLATARRANEPGSVRTVRATIDLVSGAGDPLLAWTERPWTYLQWDRIAATRYVWGSFLLGQIYLGGAGPQFVPPHTAEWFADDLARPTRRCSSRRSSTRCRGLARRRGRRRRLRARVRRARPSACTCAGTRPPRCSSRPTDGVTWEPVDERRTGWVAGDGAASSTAADRRPAAARRHVPAPRRR